MHTSGFESPHESVTWKCTFARGHFRRSLVSAILRYLTLAVQHIRQIVPTQGTSGSHPQTHALRTIKLSSNSTKLPTQPFPRCCTKITTALRLASEYTPNCPKSILFITILNLPLLQPAYRTLRPGSLVKILHFSRALLGDQFLASSLPRRVVALEAA